MKGTPTLFVVGAIVVVSLSSVATAPAQRLEDLDEGTRATLEQIRAVTEKVTPAFRQAPRNALE